MFRAPRNIPLSIRILIDFVIVIVVLALCVFVLGSHVIRKEVLERTQDQVKRNLTAVRGVYYQELDNIKTGLDLIDYVNDITDLKDKLELDYLFRITKNEQQLVTSEIVQAAFAGNPIGGTRLIARDEFAAIGLSPERKLPIRIRSTRLARPTNLQQLDSLMSIEYARPVYENGQVTAVIYGGKILNRNFALIDAMHQVVFKNEYYRGKPVGTVTIFEDDVRVATNVLDDEAERAIGTRVSDEVYRNVVEQGKTWIDRAFVVTDWYVTAYEPIHSIDGERIGILYVGTLEAPFMDRAALIGRQYFQIVMAAMVFGAVIALVLTASIVGPLKALTRAVDRISHGDLDYRLNENGAIREFNIVGHSFNSMARKIKDRDACLKITNTKLTEINRSYLDMISYVTHEIKGMLSSVMLNAHAVKDGMFGPVNETQQKVLRQITRNLDYFAATVKNFFNLSRIEKGEMIIHPCDVGIGSEIIESAVGSFLKIAQDKDVKIEQDVDSNLKIRVDRDLFLMAVNNLVGNAVKYCTHGGVVSIRTARVAQSVELSVLNDGEPIPESEQQKLFKKFSRLNTASTHQAKGTGLGLFITLEIITKHGGTVGYRAHAKRNEFYMRLPHATKTPNVTKKGVYHEKESLNCG